MGGTDLVEQVSNTLQRVTMNGVTPTTTEGILDVVRRILLKKRIRSILLRVNEPVVYHQALPADGELEELPSTFEELSPLDVARNRRMSEFDSTQVEVSGVGAAHLIQASFELTAEKLVPSHLILGEGTLFWEYMGLSKLIGVNLSNFFGLQMHYERELPDDVFLLCGSKVSGGSFVDIAHSIKCSIPIEDTSKGKRTKSSVGDNE